MDQLQHLQDLEALHLGHYILIALSMLSNIFMGWLAWKATEAKHDREWKFRMLQYQIESNRQDNKLEFKELRGDDPDDS